jgi:hypothetical protein
MIDAQTPPGGGRAAGPEINCNALDKRQFIDPEAARQAPNPRNPIAVREAKLELLREAIHEACGFIRLHGEGCQISVEAGDDTGAIYSLSRLIAHTKHAARIGIDLRAIRDESRLQQGSRPMTGAPFHRRPNLRLVPPATPLRCLFTVRINVLDGHSAFGRSRAFRLVESDVEQLIHHALRLESRA